jgi:WD40 repeat protein
MKHGAVVSAVAAWDRCVVTAGKDGVLLLWSVDRGSSVKVAEHTRAITALALDRAAETLALGTAGGGLEVWNGFGPDPSPQRIIQLAGMGTVTGRGTVTAVAFGNGTLAATFGSGYLVVWEMPDGKKNRSLDAHFDGANGVAFSAEGSIATCGNDGKFQLWTRDLKPTLWFRYVHPLTSVAFNATGEMVAIGDEVGLVRLVNLRSERPASQFNVHRKVSSLQFFRDRYLAVGCFNNTVSVFDIPENQCIQNLLNLA